MAKPFGRCRLCGYHKKLTPEHIPPRAAFNESDALFETMQDMLGFSGRKYTKFRGGIHKTALCERCNNDTGAWYTKTGFIDWAKQGIELLDKIEGKIPLILPFHIKPLNVLKQIIVMNLAVLPEDRIDYYEELRQFVLNPQQKYLPSHMKVLTYLNRGGRPRLVDQEVVISKLDNGTFKSVYVNSEITLPPFGYCICSTSSKGTSTTKSLAETEGLYDITWFSEFDYNIWTSVFLKLPVLETHEPFPLDYRSKSEVNEHRRRNNLFTY